MDILSDIRMGFANLDAKGGMLPIVSLDDGFPAWIFREEEVFGVAVECPGGAHIAERFAGARLMTVDRMFFGAQHHLLRLESTRESLRNEFAVVCAQMVTPGEAGGQRYALLNDPLGWWENWRQLLGNAVVNDMAYSVLGEMLVLERLFTAGLQAEWTGPLAGSIDIETPGAGYEVKSTLSRYESVVNVSGQFQLGTPDGRKLFLVHQRLEPSLSGDSIDSVAARLIALGQHKHVLDSLLLRCGLAAGSAARVARFKLLDSQLYAIDDDFPRITPSSFVGGVLPTAVVRFEYQVDLSGFPSSPF